MVNEESTDKQISLYTPLSEFQHCFSSRTYTRLGIAGIDTLGDLVSKSKEELLLIKSFGQASLKEVEKFLGEIGYSLKYNSMDVDRITVNDKINNTTISKHKVSLDTPLKDFRSEFSLRAYNALARAGIHTLEELLSKSFSELLKINYIGKTLLNEIICFVHSLGYTFEEEKIEDKTNEIRELETKIDTESKTNDEIISRIALKEKLLKRYNYLIDAKKDLLKQEQELDEQIRKALETLQKLGVKDEQKLNKNIYQEMKQ